MTSIEDIALRVVNSMNITIINDYKSNNNNNRKSNNYLGINKLNIETSYPYWFYLGYSYHVQIKVNNLIKRNFDKLIQQRVYEILSKDI